MELEQYFAIVRKWWWLAAACVLVAALSSYLGTLQMPRIYQATTTVMVGQALEQTNPNSQDFWISEQLAQTYATMIQRRPIRQAAAEALGLSYVPGASARQVPGTQLLEISVQDTDPERASAIANEIARQLILQSPTESPEAQERRAFIQTQLEDLEVRIEETRTEIDEEQARLEAANSARAIQQYQSNISALQQKLSNYQATYATLMLSAEGGANYISIIEPAFPPSPNNPISPNVGQTVLLASAIGLLLAVGGALLIEFLDDTVKTPDDVARTSDLPTLGTIARITGDEYADKLIAVHEPLSPIVEAYRVLRTNIQFSSVDNPARALMVTSPGPSEGKSITLANLAVVMAQSGMKVIVVDTDMRRPVQHKIFGVSNSYGLSDIIVKNDSGMLDHLQSSGVTNLWVLPSGSLPPNPAELLGSERMNEVAAELREMADVVLFDSPPVLVVADSAILSSRVDGVLLINDAGRTRRNAAERAAEEMRRVRAQLLGVILNRLSGGRDGYYHSTYNYYYYGRDGDGAENGNRRSWLEEVLPFVNRRSNGSGD